MSVAMPETGYDTTLQSWVMELPDDEMKCEARSGCDAAAEWAAIARPCSHNVGNVCNSHHEKEVRTMAAIGARCDICLAVLLAITWNRI